MTTHRILIVEDEFIIAQNLCDILVEMGYHVVGQAFDAAEALEMLAQGDVDLILLDITLGRGMDGIALAQVINAQFGIPFVFLTSHSDTSTISRASEALPSGYLVKPFNRPEILAAIQIAMAKQQNDAQHREFFVKVGAVLKKVAYQDITYLKADRVYVEIHRKEKLPLLVRESLNVWEEKLPADFLRVHRSYIVHLSHVTSIGKGSVVVDGVEISITRQVRDQLLLRLGPI